MLPSLGDALLRDAAGAPTRRHLTQESRDWDEISALNDDVYMPFRARPTDRATPESDHYTAAIGGFTLSRFRYGAGVDIDRFEPGAGRAMALTTLHGVARHHGEFCTGEGESFLVDTSRSSYRFEVPGRHLQLNLSFSHGLLAELYERWHGVPADPRMWELSFQFGGTGSSWLSLLEYASRCIAEMPDQVAGGPLGRHMEEMLGLNLLTQWSRRFSDPAYLVRTSGTGPGYVARAEEYMREHARTSPTLTEVAAAVGVSARALTNAFRTYRDQSPIAQLREIRMNGVRADLLSASREVTVASVISSWGYVNQGVFAQAYRKRYGECPSDTLGRLRGR
ncbi:AraC family transcriptional regulator [Nocardioides sp. NPDC006303]|uniref:helix-turn-helix transcriptional regulator n=1 Tax=Nocardioides sp. NPDC006303 TaxID=3156747 RepID=UPI0033B0FF4B